MDAATPPIALSQNISEVATFLKANARRARFIGNSCVAVTLLIGGLILVLFLYYSQETTKIRLEGDIRIIELQNDQRFRNFEALRLTMDGLAKIQDKEAIQSIERKISSLLDAFLQNDSESVAKRAPLGDELIYNITSSVVRIGAVLIGIFLIQIMVTFGRYYYKLAEHLSMTAALIGLSGGKVTELKVLAPLLLPSKIDFGKPPTSPTEKMLDGAFGIMKELTKKIPTH